MSGDYIYERLTPDRFQTFVSSLLAPEYPGYQVYPVGQADGGRDGVAIDGSGDRVVVQIKFKRDLRTGEDYYHWLTKAVAQEAPKIERLATLGAKRYIIATNVPGTAYSNRGTMDRVQHFLDTNLPIPAQCLWRADLDARLNNNYDLKWFFSELMATPDVLRGLLIEGIGEDQERRNAALQAYLRAQYRADSQVKFKQSELQATSLLNLFVDVPARIAVPTPSNDGDSLLDPRFVHIIRDVSTAEPSHGSERSRRNLRTDLFRTDDHAAGGARRIVTRPLPAASILLHSDSAKVFPNAVVEGAPGQGKSTLAQYLCQVHRMRLLGLESELKRLPQHHIVASTRIPFKVDLRDLALWLEGVDHRRKLDRARHGQTPSLETFLAHDVGFLSGGQEFGASDIYALVRRLPVLIVLDGFDEVATPVSRQMLIEHINLGLERLSSSALSVQTVVTSRPSALPNSPRFNETQWRYISLDDIPRPLALQYAGQWGRARGLDSTEIQDIAGTLAEKLESPHLRDLARNPMQLTILLTLIHLRGPSLPDQRTALYTSYIEVFFNRESEKTAIVRDHRQLLIDLHGFLAWRMHAEAEESGGDGRIFTDDLRESIREFLRKREYSSDIVDLVFEGVVQRVVALVSRSEGTFEFEVQPLREYFAAHHLYHTSPYSPAGAAVAGTKPEILQALIANPYWQNVLRFFAGFYSVGEVPGLASDLIEVLEQPMMPSPSYHRVLALNLLRDWVFHQSPLWTRKLVDATVDRFTLRLAGDGALSENSDVSIALPTECGGELAARRALDSICELPTDIASYSLASVIAGGLEPSEIEEKWWMWARNRTVPFDELMRHAGRLNILDRIDDSSAVKLHEIWPDKDLPVELCQAGCPTFFAQRELRRKVEARIFECDDVDSFLGSSWQTLVWPLHPYSLAALLRRGIRQGGLVPAIDVEAWHETSDLAQVALSLQTEREESSGEFAISLKPWQRLIDRLVASFGDGLFTFLVGCTAAGIVDSTSRGKGAANLFDHDVPLTERCRHARFRASDLRWWRGQLDAASSPVDRQKWAVLVLSWASPAVHSSLADELSATLSSFPEGRFRRVLDWVSFIRRESGRPEVGEFANLRSRLDLSMVRGGFAVALLGNHEKKRAFSRTIARSDIDAPQFVLDEVFGWHVSWLQRDAAARGWSRAVTDIEWLIARGARSAGDGSIFRYGPGPDGVKISKDVARSFLRRADELPYVALRVADWKLSQTRPPTPLGRIARDARWHVD